MHVYRSGPMKDAYLFQKKGPLVIEHPTRTLLGSERSLCLYAYNAALKEQWYRALQTALEKDRLRNLGNPPSPGLPPAPVSPTRGDHPCALLHNQR